MDLGPLCTDEGIAQPLVHPVLSYSPNFHEMERLYTAVDVTFFPKRKKQLMP